MDLESLDHYVLALGVQGHAGLGFENHLLPFRRTECDRTLRRAAPDWMDTVVVTSAMEDDHISRSRLLVSLFQRSPWRFVGPGICIFSRRREM